MTIITANTLPSIVQIQIYATVHISLATARLMFFNIYSNNEQYIIHILHINNSHTCTHHKQIQISKNAYSTKDQLFFWSHRHTQHTNVYVWKVCFFSSLFHSLTL